MHFRATLFINHKCNVKHGADTQVGGIPMNSEELQPLGLTCIGTICLQRVARTGRGETVE